MWAIVMAGSSTFWLTLTNIVLGILVVICVLMVALQALCETLSKLKRRRSYGVELNHDMREMFARDRPSVAARSVDAHSDALKQLEALCRIWRWIAHWQSRKI